MVILTSASFGTSKTGLLTVGYQPKDATGAWLAVRQTVGVAEVGSGIYEASYDAPTGTVAVHWDSGEATPRYYIDDAILQAIRDNHGAGQYDAVGGDATAANQAAIIGHLTTGDVGLWATRGLTMIEIDGVVYRYTANALELGPVGGSGGDATLQNQIDLKHITPNG